MDYVRAFFHVALSVEVATVFMFVGAACSLSWPFFFIAYQAQYEALNPKVLEPRTRMFHLLGSLGLLAAAVAVWFFDLEHIRSMSAAAEQRYREAMKEYYDDEESDDDDADDADDADENDDDDSAPKRINLNKGKKAAAKQKAAKPAEPEEDEIYGEEDEADAEEQLRIFTLRSLLGRGNLNTPIVMGGLLGLASVLGAAVLFYNQRGRGAMAIWPSTEFVLVQGVATALFSAFEEVGLRGFVHRRLRRVMPLVWASGFTGIGWLVWRLPLFLYLPDLVCADEAACTAAIGFHALSLVGQSLLIGIVADHCDFALLPSIVFRTVNALGFAAVGFTSSRATFDLLEAEVCVGIFIFLSALWKPVAINDALKQD